MWNYLEVATKIHRFVAGIVLHAIFILCRFVNDIILDSSRQGNDKNKFFFLNSEKEKKMYCIRTCSYVLKCASKLLLLYVTIPRGLMARIPGFHPGGPGSIPGVGENFFAFHSNISKLVLLLFTTYFFKSKLRYSQNF